MTHSTAALVTGCSTGIGRATALALHHAGLPVYATARQETSLRELSDAGLATLALDVTDERSMQAAIDRISAAHGAVGVLVNNAGYALQGPFEQTVMSDVRRQFETNVFGLVRLTQLVLPGMRAQRWGRVVNMSSMGGRFTLPGGAFYHASKHAVEALSDGLRLEVRTFGVDVIVIEPGPVVSAFGETAVATIDSSDDGPYDAFNRKLAQRIRGAYEGRSGRSAVRPGQVADVVVRAVQSDRPRTRYVVGGLARGAVLARRLLPDRMWDRFVRLQYPIP